MKEEMWLTGDGLETERLLWHSWWNFVYLRWEKEDTKRTVLCCTKIADYRDNLKYKKYYELISFEVDY